MLSHKRFRIVFSFVTDCQWREMYLVLAVLRLMHRVDTTCERQNRAQERGATAEAEMIPFSEIGFVLS